MVFEALVSPTEAEHRPWELLFLGALYSSFALIISHYVFSDDASLVFVFLTTMAATPLLYGAVKMEEKKEFFIEDERSILREHAKVLSFLLFYFVGVMVSLSLWFVALPGDVSATLFSTQLRDIARIEQYSSAVLGYSILPVAKAFGFILWNNIKVMILALLFSFFYGTGALFILTWNASVVAAAVGLFAVKQIEGSYLIALPLGLLRYSLHGIPEMLAYFVAGLAGGIISVAVIRHDFEPTKTKIIIKDSLWLLGSACVLLVGAALLEVFVTPLLFS